MSLADDADPAVLQAVGDADLPERAIAPELRGHAGVDQVREPRGTGLDHVTVDVEFLVVHPDRRVQAERHLRDALPVPRRAGEPARDVIAKITEGRGRTLLGRAELSRPANMHMCVRALDSQERVIERG
jgi:hypothetical protein